MNVLFVLRSIGDNLGGVEIVTITLANKFVEEGHDVFIFLFTKGDFDLSNRLNEKIKVFVAGEYKFNNRIVALFSKVLIDNNINVIINQWGLPFLPMRIIKHAKRHYDIKVISVYHNNPSENGRLRSIDLQLSNAKGKLMHLLLLTKRLLWHMITSSSMKYVYNNSDLYIVLSNSYVKEFIKFTKISTPNKIRVQTNPITISERTGDIDFHNKKQEIIYVGRLDNVQKRVSRIVDIWNCISSYYNDWNLTIIGEGPEKQSLLEQIKRTGAQNISLEGFQDPVRYYQRAAFLLLTSEYEGFPLVIAESMYYGVIPIVYGSYPAVYDIINDGVDGYIVKPDDSGHFLPRRMAERICSLIESDCKREQMAHACVRKSLEFSVDNIYKQWMQTFSEL